MPGQRVPEGWATPPNAKTRAAMVELAELLDEVVVHATTHDVLPLAERARTWSERLRHLLEKQQGDMSTEEP